MNKKANLHLEITNTLQCNMNCKYCFEKEILSNLKKDINDYTDLQINFIKQLVKTHWFKTNYDSKINLTFFGGEPTLRVDSIIKFVDELRNVIQAVYIISNGYYFNDKLKKFLKENKDIVRVQLSYDGKYTHDKWRIDKKGMGTSTRVKETLKWLVDNKIIVYLNSVINPEDFKYLYDNFLDFVDIYKQYGVLSNYAPKIDLLGNFKINEEIHKEYLKNLRESLKKIIKFYLKNKDYPKIGYLHSINRRFCSVGINLFGLIENKIIPCHGFIYDKEFWQKNNPHIIANLNENIDLIINKIDNFREQAMKVFQKEPEKCKNCIATTCFRCNSITYSLSNKKNYWERWIDYGYNKYICDYYREIGKMYRVYQKLKGEI